MIGLIKLTSVDDKAFYVNPLQITMFTPSTPEFCAALGADPNRCVPGATTVLLGGLPLQMKDTPRDIISALIRLRDQTNRSTIAAMRAKQKEDWEDYGDEEANED